MAQDVLAFDVTVNPGGSAASPNVYALTMPPREVVGVEILIPDGCKGSVHLALGSTGTAIIPSNVGAYLTGNDEVIRWPLDGYHNSGSWQLHAYNAGSFPHTLQVRFLCNLPVGPPVHAVRPLSLAALGG